MTTHIIPNPGLHLTQYTIVAERAHDYAPFSYEVKALCDTCAGQTPNKSKMGEVINGYCDGCGAGPSVGHFRLADPPADPADNGQPIGPDQSIWDGQKIAHHFHKNRNRFFATLRNLDVITRAQWAVAYAEYMSHFNTTRTPLTAAHVMMVWGKTLGDDIQVPPRAA